MAELIVGIDGTQAKREADEVKAKLDKLAGAARDATSETSRFGKSGAASLAEIRKASAQSADAIRRFVDEVNSGKLGQRQMGAAAAQLEAFRQKIEAVKATGGPVPQSWMRALDAQSRALDKATQAASRNKVAMEAQKRTLEDAARAAGGFRDRMDLSDIAGKISPKLEQLTLKAGLLGGAFFLVTQAVGKLGGVITDLGSAYNIRGLDSLGASLQSIASLDFAKTGRDLGQFWATVRDAPPPVLGEKGAAYMPRQEAGERLAQAIDKARKAESDLLAEWSVQKQQGIASNAVLESRAALAAGLKKELNALGIQEDKRTADLAAADEQIRAVSESRKSADAAAKASSEAATRALQLYTEQQIQFADRSASSVAAIKRQVEAQQRMTKAYLEGPKAVKSMTKALQLEEDLRNSLASGSISDSPIIRFWTELKARVTDTAAAISDAISKMNQMSKARGLTAGQLDPINSSPSMAAAGKNRFFETLGVSEEDFRKAHETAREWRDREIAEIEAAAGDNLALVEYREQAILDIQRAYAEEMINTAQRFLSNVQGILSSLSALGINVGGAQKAVGQAQAGMDLYQQGAGAYQAYNSSALAGSGVGTVAIMAAAVLAIAKWYKDRGQAESKVNLYQMNNGGLQYDYRRNNMGRDTIGPLQTAIQAVIKTAAQFIRELGGTLVPGANQGNDLLTLGASGRGKKINYWVKLASGIIENFGKDLDAAMEYAAIQAVKLAETKGLDPIVAAMIQASTAKKLDAFQADIAAAQAVSRLGTSGSSNIGEIDRLAELQRMMMQTLPHASGALVDALSKIADASAKVWQAERDRLYGLPQIEDYTQRIADGEALEAKRLQERERLLAAIAAQQAAINAAMASASGFGGPGGLGGNNGGNGGLNLAPGRPPGNGNYLPSMVDEAQAALDKLFEQLAGIDEAIDFQKIKDGIKNDILGALYGYLEGNKKYAAQILAWKKKELELTFEQYKLQLIALQMWDEATQKIWADALAAAGASLVPRRGGSGQRDDVRDALRDYNRSKMSAVAGAIDDINRKWDDHAKAAGKNATLLAQIAAARKDEIDQLVKQAKLTLRRDYLAFTGKGGGDIGAGMRAIGDQANDLVERARELMKLGKMSKADFQAMRDAIRDAAQTQRQSLVTDTANQMFLQMYDLLGKTEESAKLRYELTVAELEIKYKELEIAVAKYELEGGFLPGLRDLINQVRAGGPALFGGGGGGSIGGADPIANTRDWWEETTRRWQSATLQLVDVLGGLALSEMSPLTPEQRFAEARQQYEATLAQAQGGDLTARESLGDMIQQYLSEAENYYGRSTANYADLFRQIQTQGLGVVSNTWARGENGVMYNAAFGGGQMLQPVIDAITRSGLASATTSTQLYQQSTQQTAILAAVQLQMQMLNSAFARFLAQQQAAA